MRGVSTRLRMIGERHSLWRHVVVALSLLAFAQAGYVTQTHIHPAAVASQVTGGTSHNKAPSRDDPQHCPICQEYVAAGAYLLPAPIVLPIPVADAALDRIVQHGFSFVDQVSHAWQSRAPPRI